MSEVHIKIYIVIIRDAYSFFIRPCFNLPAWTKVHVQFFELSWILTDSKQSEEQAPALQMSNYTCLIVYQCIRQFQLHPGPPPPQPHFAFTLIVSPGGGAFANLVLPRGQAFANPGALPKLLLGEAGIDWCRILFICLCDNYFISFYFILGWCWRCCKGSQGGL